MNLKDLLYFNHLAHTLSFTATAEHFYVSQPSISMAIKRLENELDTILIDRKRIHKKLSLTETGDILYRYSHQILKSVEQAEEEIHDFKHQIVYFGFLPTIGGYFISHLLPHLEKFSSSMKFIEEESSDTMLELVKTGKVPIAIIGSDEPTFNDNSLIQIPLKQEDMALWVSKSNPLSTKKKISPTVCKEDVFISLEKGYMHHRIFDDWVRSHHLNSIQTIYTKEIQTALSITSSTNMIAFLSDILVRDHSGLVKVEIDQPPQIYISLIVNKHIHQSNTFQTTFNQKIIDLAQEFRKPFKVE